MVEKYQLVLKYSTLFWGIEEQDLLHMIQCLDGRVIAYGKEEEIYHSGDTVQSVGVVLSGSISIIQNDFWGNRSILGTAQ